MAVDEPKRENAAPRHRLSRLSAASKNINENLDFDKVLQQVLNNACELTDARYGGLAIYEEQGDLQVFISAGFTPEEHEKLIALPRATTFLRGLNRVERQMQIGDLDGFTRALGLEAFRPPVAIDSILVAPLRKNGVEVGAIYLTKGEEGQEFTGEDEEILMLFASQAVMVIANARMYREEQRARASLETLINTSPVGVAVFDAKTGAPTSFNREARRILESLRSPDQPVDHLLEALTLQRADGRRISLAELPLAQVLSTGEILRAEEVVLQAPNDRSITILINATPVLSEEKKVDSVVVTLQDMTSLEMQGRLRAEFLGMVSHELRTPLTSIKGSATTLLDPAMELSRAELNQFHRIIDTQADRMRDLLADLLDVAHIETGTLAVNPEPSDVASLVDKAFNVFLSGGGRNNVHFDLPPHLPLVMADRRRIVQVLTNLLANAASHSRESSSIRVTAVRRKSHVAISVSDQGRGIPADMLPHLFRKFSRENGEDHGIGGAGLGLAICKGIVEAHGGRIQAESDGPDLGARFTFTLPVAVEAAREVAAGPAPLAARSPRERPRILTVDDDPHTLRYIHDALSNEGYTPIMTGAPEEAVRLMEKNAPDLILLDMMLPGTSGIELMEELLAIADVPVIFISAYRQEQVVVQALDMGADDYVVKPFPPSELTARIRAALRRREASEQIEPSEPYTLGGLTIDYAERQVSLAGKQVRLTAIEYRMLVELSSNSGRALTYGQLLRRLWNIRGDGDLRPMRTVVKSLRRKLGDDAKNPTYIFTEPRTGYRMAKSTTPE